MLLLAHIKKLKGIESESQRLIEKATNDQFDPNNWFKDGDFDEFISSVRVGIDTLSGVTKSEKRLVRVEGVLALLNAIYIWPNKFPSFKERNSELEQLISEVADKVVDLLP
jgi:hypothetical protein